MGRRAGGCVLVLSADEGKLQQVARIIEQDPAVQSVVGTVGGSGFGPHGGAAGASVGVTLKPRASAAPRRTQVIDGSDRSSRKSPGLPLPAGRAGHRRRRRRSANSEYQYTLLGDDLSELRSWSQKLRRALQDIPEVTMSTRTAAWRAAADLIVDRGQRGAARAHGESDRQCAGGRFRPGSGFHHLQSIQSAAVHVVMEVAPEFWRARKFCSNCMSALPAAQ